MSFDWLALSPVLVLSVMAVVVLLTDAFLPTRRWDVSAILGGGAIAAAGGLSVLLDRGAERATMCTPVPGPQGERRCSFAVDDYTLAMWWILLAAALLVVLMAAASAPDPAMPPGELHFLLLASVAGALTLAASRDLVSLVVALELVSLPSIAMVALRRGDRAAARAGWTFFLASVTATSFTLMGVAFVYGATGSVYFADIATKVLQGDLPPEVLRTGVVLLIAGLVFKVGAVPFHMWVPDTYAGATPAVAAYLSVVSKTAGFAGLLIVLGYPFGALADSWGPLMAVVAGLTMTVGNVAALRTRDAVGLLAWSSVAQAGFVIAPMAALLAGDLADTGLVAAIRYLGVYAIANLAAFAVVASVRERTGRTDLEAFRGLLRHDRLGGITLAAAVLALAGFPPAVIGLVAKYVVLAPVVRDGHEVLAVVMAVNVAIALAYYLRLLVLALSPAEPAERADRGGVGPRLAMGLGLLGLVATSVWPVLLTSALL